jgi:hypothetical protein
MSLKSKVSISLCLLLAVSICFYAEVPCVHSWDWGTHHFITQNAIKLMPSSLSWFFDNYSEIIDNYCIMPDVWRSEGLETGYSHYYDYDIPLENHILDPSLGVLPWTVQDNFNMIVQALKENEWSQAALIMGAMAHYVEDASMPLHATSNYNPGGNHTRYESKVDSEISLDNVKVDVQGFVPHKLDNIFNSMMQLLQDSYSNAEELTLYLQYNTIWNSEIKTLTQNRLNTDIPLLADVWYTAFVQAGISSSPPPQPSTHSRNYTPCIVGGVFAIAAISIVITLYTRRKAGGHWILRGYI